MPRKRRKTVAEINVVPYIDVMLVLLVIFMVTAPLMNLGVDVELPRSNAKPMEKPKDPMIISIDKSGQYYLVRDGNAEPIDEEELRKKVAAIVAENPKLPILVGGDTDVEYGRVYGLMALVQQSGGGRVGLMSVPVGKAP